MIKYFFMVFLTINLVTVPQAHAGIFSALVKVITLSSKSVNKGQKALKLPNKVKHRNNNQVKMPKHLDKAIDVGSSFYDVVPNTNNCDNRRKTDAAQNNRCDSYR